MCRYREDAFPGIEGILPSCKGKTPEQEPLTCRQGPETDAQRRLRNGPAELPAVDAQPTLGRCRLAGSPSHLAGAHPIGGVNRRSQSANRTPIRLLDPGPRLEAGPAPPTCGGAAAQALAMMNCAPARRCRRCRSRRTSGWVIAVRPLHVSARIGTPRRCGSERTAPSRMTGRGSENRSETSPAIELPRGESARVRSEARAPPEASRCVAPSDVA